MRDFIADFAAVVYLIIMVILAIATLIIVTPFSIWAWLSCKFGHKPYHTVTFNGAMDGGATEMRCMQCMRVWTT